MKKVVVFLFLVFLLFSCSDEKSDVSTSSFAFYENSNFSMSVPSNWSEIKDTDTSLPQASIWTIEAAFKSNTSVWGFSNNVLILSAELNKSITSKEYSITNNLWAEKNYLEYLKLSSQDIVFSDWDISIAYEFEAKYNLEAPKLKFIQVSKICHETKAYLITVAIPTSVNDISRYLEFLKTFTCKN